MRVDALTLEGWRNYQRQQLTFDDGCNVIYGENAEELTPEAPLVLDDALVRFDDKRMAAALGILREMAKDKQVICFTCQDRESEVS